MKTLAFMGDNVKKAYPIVWVKPPAHDKTATYFTFAAPYRRVRIDKHTKNFYVLVEGKKTPVIIATVEV